MKKQISIFILLIFVCFAYSINFAQVKVVLLDSKTMDPISTALVNVEGDYDYTNKNGEADIDSLLTGPNLITIKKEGYKDFSKVFFLYKGINYRKILIDKEYKKTDKQSEKEVKNSVSFKQHEKDEEEYLKRLKDQESDIYWTRDRFLKPETQEVIVKPYESFDDIRQIVQKLDGKSEVVIKLIDKDSNAPLDKVPVFVNNSVIFSDKEGRVVYRSVANEVDVLIDVKGIERISKKIRLTKPKNYIEFHCNIQGGY